MENAERFTFFTVSYNLSVAQSNFILIILLINSVLKNFAKFTGRTL